MTRRVIDTDETYEKAIASIEVYRSLGLTEGELTVEIDWTRRFWRIIQTIN